MTSPFRAPPGQEDATKLAEKLHRAIVGADTLAAYTALVNVLALLAFDNGVEPQHVGEHIQETMAHFAAQAKD